VCTVSGATVTYTAAGSCVIDANQAGTARYAGAPQVQRVIAVKEIPQSISLTAPASGTVRGSGALSATGGGSGNPVVFSSGSGTCRVSGTTVTYTAAGRCVVDANQAGNARYADAPQVQRTITVRKLPQSISFTGPPSETVSSSVNLWATGGPSGNPVVFSVDRSSGLYVCRVSGTMVTFNIPGTCVVDANQAGNDRYAAAPRVQQKITVIETPQYYHSGPGE
jgi:hypothetical protein